MRHLGFQSDTLDALDTCGFNALRMAIPYVLLQMIFPFENLLLVEMRTDVACVALVLMRGAMSEKGIPPCVYLVAKGLRAPPGFMGCSSGMLIQLLKVPKELLALLATMPLVVVFVRVVRLGRRS